MGLIGVLAQIVSLIHDKWARGQEAVDGRARPRWGVDERRRRSRS
jgi:hypothetical protein